MPSAFWAGAGFCFGLLAEESQEAATSPDIAKMMKVLI
jgi:hypothetical protein